MSNVDSMDLTVALDRLALGRPNHYTAAKRAAEGKQRGANAALDWVNHRAAWGDLEGLFQMVALHPDGPINVPPGSSLAPELTRLGRDTVEALRREDAFDRGFVDTALALYQRLNEEWDDDDD